MHRRVTMKKKIITLLSAVMLLVTLPMAAMAQTDSTNNYSDIAGTWFSEAAATYGYSDIFSTDDGKFHPNQSITRIEFARLLHQALGITINYFVMPDIANDFNDMTNEDIGASNLIDLAAVGIIERGGSFEPEKSLDRETMIHWTINALDYMTGGDYAIIMIMPEPFNDDSNISAAYKNDIVKSVILGLIKGRGDNMLFPKDGATRAEAVTVVSRLLPLIDSLDNDVNVTASSWLNADGSLVMMLTVQNNTDKEVTINHTSGQTFDFKLFDENGDNIYTWSADKSFIAALTTTTLLSGENIVFSDTLNSGSYVDISKAVTLKAFITGTSSDFTIDEDGYTATITK